MPATAAVAVAGIGDVAASELVPNDMSAESSFTAGPETRASTKKQTFLPQRVEEWKYELVALLGNARELLRQARDTCHTTVDFQGREFNRLCRS